MNTGPRTTTVPPKEIALALERLRAGDNAGAFAAVTGALSQAEERAPYLAIASLAALRMKQPARAIPMLRELIALNPQDHASRFNLAAALLEAGDVDGALVLCSGSPRPDLARIEAYIHQQNGALDAAAKAYSRALQADPDDLASWNNLGNVLAQGTNFDEAIRCFERAISLAPGDLNIYLNLADLLRRADRGSARLKVMRDAARIAPDNRRVQTELAQAHAHVEDLDAAIAILEATTAHWPEFGESHIELGRLYEALNRTDDLARLAASVDPASSPPEAAFLFAWLALRENRFDEAVALANSIPETIHPMRRFSLIGSIADRMDDAPRAFAAFERMNEAALADSPTPSGRSFRDSIEGDLERWTPEWAASWRDSEPGDQVSDPVFLVGFPRSGTTLLDTMLMGLPELSVLEERPMIAGLIKAVASEDLAALPRQRVNELRASYFATAREFGWDDRRRLVDKHPLNMARVPLIHRLFPRAKFILAERHPYDVVLSCFMANFQLNFAMRSFASLDEAARTYDTVFRAWEQALALFPVDLCKVRYERLVEDAGGELAPLVEWLGLAWNDRLLAHQQTAKERGRVRTASYSQIGEELYQRARYRWKRYVAQLEPVMPILRPWAERLGYEVDDNSR